MNEKTQLEKRNMIRDKVSRYKRVTNVCFFIGIINLFSFILALFRNDVPRLSFALNIYLHQTFMNTFNHELPGYLFSGLLMFLFSLVFMLITPSVKSGKLIPLIILFSLYLGDFIFLWFLDDGIYINNTNRIVSILTHIVILGYFIFLLIDYYRIVSLSKKNKRENQKD